MAIKGDFMPVCQFWYRFSSQKIILLLKNVFGDLSDLSINVEVRLFRQSQGSRNTRSTDGRFHKIPRKEIISGRHF